MTAPRLFLSTVLIGAASWAASPGDVEKAALGLESAAAKAPKALAMEFQMRAAEALREHHPDLARKFADQTVADLRGGKEWVVGYGVIQGLAAISPSDALSVLPNMAPGYAPIVVSALVQSHRTDQAVALYLDLLKRGQMRVAGSSSLINPLSKTQPATAVKLFQDVLATLPGLPDPADASWIVNTTAMIAPISAGAAADALDRVLKAASTPEYGAGTAPTMIGAFSAGSKPLTTSNTRDTLLLAAALRLREIAPDRLANYQEALSKWDLTGSLQLKSISYRGGSSALAATSPERAEPASINQRMGQVRGKATDAERAELVIQIARDIRALPASQAKLNNIRSLASLSTEGDLGNAALTAVAATLAGAIRDSFPVMIAEKQVWPYGDAYIELAKLVRYERVEAPLADPALDTAGALLELRERVQQESGFTLTSLDGKAYTQATLKGRIVLLNFWATWCPPCRKEMPDMEKLYKQYEARGLVVLAVSDEDRETVERFLAKTPYTFPVLLDPGRKVHAAFMVDGIPKSFIFDREGRLAAQAIDMRTESQFLELLKRAGLE
jgi:peroxiredoxin